MKVRAIRDEVGFLIKDLIYEAKEYDEYHYLVGDKVFYKSRFVIAEEETKMSNKEKLQRQLEQLQKTIDDAQKQAEKIREELIKADHKALLNMVENPYIHFTDRVSVYPNQATYEAYRGAFKTFIELRKCQGTEPASGTYQHSMMPTAKMEKITILSSTHQSDKMMNLSPTFDTEDNLRAAIESVGKENILNMFKTFHGVK